MSFHSFFDIHICHMGRAANLSMGSRAQIIVLKEEGYSIAYRLRV
jgi:hypothetical protein